MLHEIVYFIITLLLLTLCLYFADRLIGNNPKSMGGGYFLRALITALVIIIIIIAVGAVLGAIGFFGIDQIATILGFVLASYAVQHILVGGYYERNVWITLVAYIFVYMIDWAANTLAGIDLIQYLK